MQVIFIGIIVKRNERSVKLIAKKNIHTRNKAMKQRTQHQQKLDKGIEKHRYFYK